MKKKLAMLSMTAVLSFLLAGCMYPEDKLSQNQTPYQDQVNSVQSAVDQFQEDNGGILPIKTREEDTPIYQKYPIDFKKISPKYMAEPPGNSFESGGIFQYVIMDAEEDPKVKLFDLRMAEAIRDIKVRIKLQGYPPYKEKIADNVYTLNYAALGFKEEPLAVSPYTSRDLHFVVSGNGDVYVDYLPDLYEAVENNKEHGYKEGDDIRSLLGKDSLFVPAYSLPYTINAKGEPIFLAK